jgi:guanylate kinase
VLLKKLRTRNPDFHFPRSATTRAKREGEGDDLYRFVTDAEFDALLKEGKVLEWAIVHGGARYGTLLEEIVPAIEQGKTVIREVDVQGFESIRAHSLFAAGTAKFPLQSIFILPESREQLISHITKRAPIAGEELNRRIASMEKEMGFADLCDAKIVNKEGKLPVTLTELQRVIGGK